MGGLTGAVHWWEESQLRVLILTSLLIQFLLFIFSKRRRRAHHRWAKFMMWLAYLGGDAVAIYALATLFNRHNAMLQVVWAPVLLIHLGGDDGITAYNIEDNELWSRHLLTAVSQVTVAIYVFCKTWPPGGDKRLLQAAIVLFVPAVLKCFQKPLALKRASINSIVSSRAAVKQKEEEMFPLEEYVERAKYFFEAVGTGAEDTLFDVLQRFSEVLQRFSEASEFMAKTEVLFVDFSPSYSRRLSILKGFYRTSERAAYCTVRVVLSRAFLLLFTKLKTVNDEKGLTAPLIMASRFFLPWAAIGLFHHSHREAYNDIDVKITYIILCCTAALELFSYIDHDKEVMMGGVTELERVEVAAQYSFIGYSARNIKYSKMMRIVSLLGCKSFLDQHWCMKPSLFGALYSKLVLRYLKDGWKEKIHDVASYYRFNNHCSSEGLRLSKKRGQPLLFDESVLLWHIATDFCFVSSSSDHSCAFDYERNKRTGDNHCSEELTNCKAVLCTQMSNYMAYLLFVNPEMLLPGSRRNLFTAAHQELEAIFKGEKPPLDKTELARKITIKLGSSSQEGLGPPETTIIQEAWMLAQKLQSLDHEKMWDVIQGVWVEMLCFSASRCRGYLHAKALGSGGEFLSSVWLLLFFMGMETFTDKLQREDLPSHEAAGTGNNATTVATSTSERVSYTTGGTTASASEAHADTAGASAPPSTSEISTAEGMV